MITLPKNFKKILMTGTALVAVSFAGEAHAERTIDSAQPNLVGGVGINGQYLITGAHNKFININLDNQDASLGGGANAAINIVHDNQTVYIFDGSQDATANTLTISAASAGLKLSIYNSSAVSTLNIVLGAEGKTDGSNSTQPPGGAGANYRNVNLLIRGGIATHADGRTNFGLNETHGKSGNIIEFGDGSGTINLGQGVITLTSGVNGGTTDQVKFSAQNAQNFTGTIVGAGNVTFANSGGNLANVLGKLGTANAALGSLTVEQGANVTIGSGPNQYDSYITKVVTKGQLTSRSALTTEGIHLDGQNAEFTVTNGMGTSSTVTGTKGVAFTTATDGTGTVTFQNHETAFTVTGTVGAADARIKNVNLYGNNENANIIFTNAVNAQNMHVSRGGTLNAVSVIDAINVAGAGNLYVNANLTSNVTVQRQVGQFNTSYGSAHLAEGISLTGNVLGGGILVFAGNGSVTGTAGVDATTRLTKVDVKGAQGTTASIGGATFIDTLEFTGAGTADFAASSNIVTLNFAEDGTALFKNGGQIIGNVATAKIGTGAVTFSNGFEVAGNLDRLREMKLTGNAKISGNARAANTTEVLEHTLTVGGTYNVDAGSSLVFRVTDPTTAGQIKVAGAATVDAGAKVEMIVNTGVLVQDGHKFVLIDGTGGNGVAALNDGNLTTSNTALLTFVQDKTNTEDLVVYVGREKVSNVGGTTPNTNALGHVLDVVGGNGDADITALQSRLGNLKTAAEVTAVLETMLPDIGAGASTAAVNVSDATSTIINNRVTSARIGSGVSSGNAARWGDAYVWMQAFGAQVEQDNRQGVAGYDADSWGMVVGADIEATDNLRAGVAFAYADTEVDSNSANIGKTEIDSYQFSLYGTYDLGDDVFVSGQLSYVRSAVETARFNVGGLAGNTARGDYDTDQYVARVELGRDIHRGNYILTPSLFTNYNYIDFDSYSEKGAGGLALRNVATDSMAIFELGVHVANEWTFDDGMGGFVKPGLHGGFRYDFANDAVATSAQLAGGGAAFKTNGVKSEPHTFNLGASLGWEIGNAVELKANYDYETKDDYEAHSGYVRVGVRF